MMCSVGRWPLRKLDLYSIVCVKDASIAVLLDLSSRSRIYAFVVFL
jgi:hypothetical protein